VVVSAVVSAVFLIVTKIDSNLNTPSFKEW
jgi:hypothetical protein